MIVDLKVHAEIVQYKGRQGSNMRPAKVVFWVRERFFLTRGERFRAKDFNMRPARKINVVVAQDSRKYLFIREEWPLQIIKELHNDISYMIIYDPLCA